VPEPILQVQSLALNRGDRRLFRDLEFSLQPGTVAVVRGANGAGKTTLLRALAGLVLPAAGEIQAFGERVDKLPAATRQRMLYLGHAEGLKQDLSVGENLRFWNQLDRGEPVTPESLTGILAEVDLAERGGQLVRHLSAGQRRRTVLARMINSPAELWLLDEPLTNLDALGRELVQRWLLAHLERGGAAVVATHTGLDVGDLGMLEIQL
jgi:heme exporter protein A